MNARRGVVLQTPRRLSLRPGEGCALGGALRPSGSVEVVPREPLACGQFLPIRRASVGSIADAGHGCRQLLTEPVEFGDQLLLGQIPALRNSARLWHRLSVSPAHEVDVLAGVLTQIVKLPLVGLEALLVGRRGISPPPIDVPDQLPRLLTVGINVIGLSDGAFGRLLFALRDGVL